LESDSAQPFSTPFEILPEWYLLTTFYLLRIEHDKFMGILSILVLGIVLLVIPVGENLSSYQNPIGRACTLSIFLSIGIYSLWLSWAL
jgi:quinol-cytochrome oxidoreductase complex cytochrome b subunit